MAHAAQSLQTTEVPGPTEGPAAAERMSTRRRRRLGRWAFALVLGLLALGFPWIAGDPLGIPSPPDSQLHALAASAAEVPAPATGQRKVVLERLGMT